MPCRPVESFGRWQDELKQKSYDRCLRHAEELQCLIHQWAERGIMTRTQLSEAELAIPKARPRLMTPSYPLQGRGRHFTEQFAKVLPNMELPCVFAKLVSFWSFSLSMQGEALPGRHQAAGIGVHQCGSQRRRLATRAAVWMLWIVAYTSRQAKDEKVECKELILELRRLRICQRADVQELFKHMHVSVLVKGWQIQLGVW